MIQRSLLRQSRAFLVRTRYVPKASPIRSPLPPLRIRSLQERIDSRCYSSADTPGEGANPDGTAVDASQSRIEDVDPIKEDLELKNKEIIDLKVRLTRMEIYRFICSRDLTSSVLIGQVPPLSSRLSKPSRTHQARCSIRPRFCHLSLRPRSGRKCRQP